jgi:hypothetical protein
MRYGAVYFADLSESLEKSMTNRWIRHFHEEFGALGRDEPEEGWKTITTRILFGTPPTVIENVSLLSAILFYLGSMKFLQQFE